ncbi:hypothetical protein LSS_18269 [Leptospira santarosai serovar Shermani str. LT 821]|uniref:Uncharacterized protein n=2 Tax=Leptospira santarosai TaxID=28183 RepID=K8XWL9_9LEPT|nr:hypothetical protein [Leptospira santarosai]EKT85301.2 hypothetical protein LSS_18269 [Leptospira santarosai serovar Shermani str. LT 821]EPG83390.1 hypothetical protein LEP1GSC048_1058 [Leptospira santarosai serovar Shermani str. 1342KT]
MENLSRQLKQKEIKPIEFAENFPVKVVKYSNENVAQLAVATFIMQYGVKEFKEIQTDFGVDIRVFRQFVLTVLSNLRAGIEALENIKGGKNAFKLLVERATNECVRVYPWLDDKYYQY